jgi:uncharacterized protein (TIGR03437 family)
VTRFACLLLAAVFAHAAPGLTLQISSETAPPSGYAQFKISPAAPALIASASISIDFDPAVFGPPISAAAFSATGDQTGYVNIQGLHLDAYVTSTSASLGQLPGLPVFVITIPILPSAKIGATSSMTLSASNWLDQQNSAYTVSVNNGTFTVGGALSIQSVTPGGGLLPSGTIVAVNGTGFDASTAITIDGVVVASTQLITAHQINVTLGGATEMTGKHVHLTNPSGASAGYFAALSPNPIGGTNPFELILPSLPSPQYNVVHWDQSHGSGFVQVFSCLLNPTASPVTATYYFESPNQAPTVDNVVIPPNGLYVANNQKFATSGLGEIYMAVSAPTRMGEFRMISGPISGPPELNVIPPSPGIQDQLTLPAGAANGFVWDWQIGTAAPQSKTAGVSNVFPVAVSLSGGAVAWLNVSASNLGSGSTQLTLTPDVSKLGAGTFTGIITVAPALPAVLQQQTGPASASFPVTIIVSAKPATLGTTLLTYRTAVPNTGPLTATPASLAFTLPLGKTSPVQYVVISPTLSPITVSASTQSDGNWINATVAGGVIEVIANASNLGPGAYIGTVTVNAPMNLTAIVPVTLTVTDPPGPTQLAISPASLALSAAVGAMASASLSVKGIGGGPPYFTVQWSTDVNDSWQPGLQVVSPVTSSQVAGTQYIAPTNLNISASAPVPGAYHGLVTVTWIGGSQTIPITFYATATPSTPPIMSAVVSSGSALPGPIAPGTLISIFGSGLGGVPITSTDFGTNLGGTQVLINGAAAPLIYSSAGQVNAVVPYEVVGSTSATLQVLAAGIQASAWSVPVAPAAPSIFTLNGSGVGQGAIVNADNSINSAMNPAVRGSIVQIYSTGGGQTSPPSSTGSVTPSAANLALLTNVTIGGVDAQVLYAGSAPGEVEGVVQINAMIPSTATPSAATPILVTIGGVLSQSGVTISVQ